MVVNLRVHVEHLVVFPLNIQQTRGLIKAD